MLTNYCIFKQNNGWELLQTWMKSALLWKNAILRWDYVEDYDYQIEEYEEIGQTALDALLADDNVELIGELEFENSFSGEIGDQMQPEGAVELVYKNVRIRKKTDKSRVKIENIPPESFRISRDAKSINGCCLCWRTS